MNDNLGPWPKKGNQLFKPDADWLNNACLNFTKDQLDLYAVGYKRAAELLVEHVKNSGCDQDTLVYPIIFLYRHYLELRLKEIIEHGNQLFDIQARTRTIHILEELWDDCHNIITKLDDYEAIAEELNAVDGYIRQFSVVDPKSMSFRYSTDKEGNPSIPDIRLINLRNFSDIMLDIASFLDIVSLVISVERDFKSDALGFIFDSGIYMMGLFSSIEIIMDDLNKPLL